MVSIISALQEAGRLEQLEIQEKRENEIRTLAQAVSQVEGFPVKAMINFYRLYGPLDDFVRMRNLSPSLEAQLSTYEGVIVIGTIDEPDAVGFFRDGDHDCDFASVAEAHAACPNSSVLKLRGFGSLPEVETPVAEFECLGLTSEILNPPDPNDGSDLILLDREPREQVAFFASADSLANPSLPFPNLQILDLSGRVNIQQFTISGRLLRIISISQNRSLTMVGLADLPKLEEIKFNRCPKLRMVKATAISHLKIIDIEACQDIDLQIIEAIIETASPLDNLRLSDMFRHGDNANMIASYNDFFKRALGHTRSIELQRFSSGLFGRRGEGRLVPMETIFDAALLEGFSSSVLENISIRGSNLFTGLPLSCGSSVCHVDASSCHNLEEIGIYQGMGQEDSFETMGVSLEKLVLNDCPALKNIDALQGLSQLQILHCQGCSLVTNEVFDLLPLCIRELDLTSCKNIGAICNVRRVRARERFEQLSWCSFKKTSVVASDVMLWMALAPCLEYLNLGNLDLRGMCLEAHSLHSLLLINSDVSAPFIIKCPILRELWIGCGYRGWPYETNRHSREIPIHGESLIATIEKANQTFEGGESPIIPELDHMLRILLPESFSLTINGVEVIQYTVDSFCKSNTRFSTFNGGMHLSDSKVMEAGDATKEKIIFHGCSMHCFNVQIVTGSCPAYLCSPKLHPRPPDEAWHYDYSEVGGGHDGGFVSQCEHHWY